MPSDVLGLNIAEERGHALLMCSFVAEEKEAGDVRR
jgi:hypothetical protein